MKQMENPENSPVCCSTGPVSLASLPSFLYLSESSYVYYVLIFKHIIYIIYVLCLLYINILCIYIYIYNKHKKKISVFETIRIFYTCFICGHSTCGYSYLLISCCDFWLPPEFAFPYNTNNCPELMVPESDLVLPMHIFFACSIDWLNTWMCFQSLLATHLTLETEIIHLIYLVLI